MIIAAGSVSTQASAIERTVDHCIPEPLATIVPATPDESTCVVLSSGVAGTMAANGSGLQMATLRNVLMAWILTLPVCVILGAATFAGGLYAVLHGPVTVLIGLAMLALLAFLVWKYALKDRPVAAAHPA